MNTATILGTHPSLSDTWHPARPVGHRRGVIIAINTAVHAVGDDPSAWWVWGDAECFLHTRPYCPRAWPGSWCVADYALERLGHLAANGEAVALAATREVDRARLACWSQWGLAETSYSSTAALHLAAWLGCHWIHTHGVRFEGSGHVDWNGCPVDEFPANTAERWKRDRAAWSRTVARLDLHWIPH